MNEFRERVFKELISTKVAVEPVEPQYFNVNDYVYVRLTDEGRKVWEDGLRKLGLPEDLVMDIIAGKEKDTKDGWTRFQLWDLMKTFGHVMINGNPRLPFETRIMLGEKL